MPSYRGFDQRDIFRSIMAARAFLLRHNDGPELRMHLAKVDDAQLQAIADATDSPQLAAAIDASRIEDNFIFVRHLLEYHADANTAYEGRNILAGLRVWGALTGNRAMAHTALDAEIEDYIRNRPLLERARAAFNRLRPQQEGAFQHYVLAIEGMAEGRIKWNDARAETLAESVQDRLEPFVRLNEARNICIGMMTSHPADPQGIVFTATRRAAQAVANAFPQYRLIDRNGQDITPYTQTPRPPQP